MIKPCRRPAICLVLLLCLASIAHAQSLTSTQSSAIDTAVAAFMKDTHVPALSIAVGINGKIAFSKGYGSADLEENVPVTPKTRFRTGSIAKPMTAVAAMQLVETKKIDLKLPIQTYCPAFPKKQWEVTTEELLEHRSGVRHYTTAPEAANAKHYASLNDSITGIFGNDALLFEPGTKMGYSTYGYVVVGCAIEGASGNPYTKYMQEHVFDAAGMADTAVDDWAAIVPNRVHFYDVTDGKVTNAQFFDSSDRIPGGGYVSTPEDLVHFAFAMLDGKLVAKDTVKEMWTPSDTAKTSYGLGWFLTKNSDGRRIVFHSGGQIGTSTMLAIAPDDHIAYAIMTDVRGINLGKLTEAIETALFAH